MPTQIARDRVRQLDAWERRASPVIAALPYLLLAMPLVVVVVEDEPGRPLTLALGALAAAWMLWFVTLHPQWRRRRRGTMAVYYLGLLVLVAALISRSPVFGFFAFAGYLSLDVLPGRWKIAGAVATAVLTATAQTGALTEPGGVSVAIFLAFVAINLLVAGGLLFFSTLQWERSEQRRAVADELQATLAENAELQERLVAQAREAGVLDERRRLAGEIHDTLAQGLTGVIAQLQAAGQAREHGRDDAAHLDTAAQLARESLSEARRSVRAIGPAALDRAQLPDALAGEAERWSARTGVPARFEVTGTARPLHPEVEVALLRTAQEALSNVSKHAGATRVGLTLSYMEDLVTLDVRDDGAGFDSAARRNGHAEEGGFGLTGMRRRVERLAGELGVESSPGSGTAISASVPALPAEGAG